ncbi:hypothetical protein [Streptomyces sp. V4I23]|uniref:hypothetical protein n=1 Tax=Streptomyces sp. V4I23 TaxID=3042282 RepID=UPI0027D8194F|nr:hypothetical protein [Streptomyces sp. V4I23]
MSATLITAAEGGFPGDLEGLNKALESLGWAPAGSTAPPYCRQWESGGITLFLSMGEGQWLADFVFREVAPEDLEERGSEALEDAAAGQILYFRSLRDELLSGIARRIETVQWDDLSFDDLNFVEWSEWRLAGRPFCLGVSVFDTDMPVFVMGRAVLSAAGSG